MVKTEMTNRAAIEEALLRRIEESKIWAKENIGVDIPTLDVRGYPARLKILQYLDDKRVEANGVRFRLFFGSDTRKFYTDLDVRLNPSWLCTEGKDDIPPYVVVYALDKNGAGDSLHWFYLSDIKQTNENLEIADWYEKFINRCTGQGDDKKLMIHRQECEAD
jgi:hypothetical protein